MLTLIFTFHDLIKISKSALLLTASERERERQFFSVFLLKGKIGRSMAGKLYFPM